MRVTEQLPGGSGRPLYLATAACRNKRRDAARRQAAGGMSVEDRFTLFRLWRGRCALCGRAVSFGEMSIEHLVPVIQMGRTEPANVAPAHKICNERKGAAPAAKRLLERAAWIHAAVTAACCGEGWALLWLGERGVDVREVMGVFWRRRL